MKKRTESYLVEQALDIEAYSAYEKNTIGYIPKFMTSLPLPVSKLETNEYERKNGRYTISIVAPSSVGLPYGTYPRRLIIHFTTIAKITKSNEIYCGKSFSELARVLGKQSSGGEKGSITALKEQFKRLFSSTINWIKDENGEWSIDSMNIARSASMLWNPINNSEYESHITLGEVFFEDIQLNAVPIDLRVIDACSHYPMAIDIYCFLTSRYFYLYKTALIPWRNLAGQSGCSYKKMSNFRQAYIKAAARVKVFYPDAKFSFNDQGMLLFPSPSHVPKKPKPPSVCTVDKLVGNL